MKEFITDLMSGRKVAILGFGREGQSSFRVMRECLPEQTIWILDSSENISLSPGILNDPDIVLIKGEPALKSLMQFDMIIKSPGIPSHALPPELDTGKITSQTDLFLRYYHRQVIGVTGTKGKSTTASLIHHILSNSGYKSILLGNIGLPPFEGIPDIDPTTRIVMELSSHQLQFLHTSPATAILLNLFQEHLDHYHSYEEYQQSKLNIGRYQEPGSYFIYNRDNPLLETLIENEHCWQRLLPYSTGSISGNGITKTGGQVKLEIDGITKNIFNLSLGVSLPGEHNLTNIMAAAAATWLAGVPENNINQTVATFKGLEHRIEYVGEYEKIRYYNDSIATIPEATIEAVRTLKEVDTLILGGYDRGIDYSMLYPFLATSGIGNIIFVGDAGRRMQKEMAETGYLVQKFYPAADYEEVVTLARKVTRKGKICLLSPAASSYDMFKNFEHRGNIYKKNVRSQTPHIRNGLG